MKVFLKKYGFYIGVCIALLPLLLWRDYTPANELRYLSIADEALRNHTFFSFSNHGLPYADKPPLYFWLIMLGKTLFGKYHMWWLGLFSLVPSLMIVRIIDEWVKDELSPNIRHTARNLLITSGLFLGMTFTLRMDMLMSLFIVLSLRTFWAMQASPMPMRRERILFPLYLFLGVFSKGPMGILIPLCATSVFLIQTKRFKEFLRYWGGWTWGILLGCCLLWFMAIYAEAGSSYLSNLLFHQTVGRAVNSFHHNEPFYYYCLTTWYALAPWSFLIIGLIVAEIKSKSPRSPLHRFFTTVGIANFIMLSCFSAKLTVYLLPIIPFLVLSAAMSLAKYSASHWLKLALLIPAVICTLTVPALLFAFTRTDWQSLVMQPYFCLAACILTTCGLYAIYILYRKKKNFLMINGDALSPASAPGHCINVLSHGLLVAIFIGSIALPSYLNPLLGYKAVCEKAAAISRQTKIDALKTWHVNRAENMDVFLGREVTVIPKNVTPNLDSLGHCLFIVPQRYRPQSPLLQYASVGQFVVMWPRKYALSSKGKTK